MITREDLKTGAERMEKAATVLGQHFVETFLAYAEEDQCSLDDVAAPMRTWQPVFLAAIMVSLNSWFALTAGGDSDITRMQAGQTFREVVGMLRSVSADALIRTGMGETSTDLN